MTDNEIIKALECCSDITFRCDGCPLQHLKYSECYELMTRSTLNLINRQQAEIERLQKQDKVAEEIIREQADKIFNLQSENDRLTDRNRALSEKADNSIIACISARAEAVKEFAERLKEHKIDIDVSFGYGREVYTEAVAVIEIDNLVKEMVGEG